MGRKQRRAVLGPVGVARMAQKRQKRGQRHKDKRDKIEGGDRAKQIYIVTRGASPRRADARLSSAHARSYRGCRQIEAVNAI